MMILVLQAKEHLYWETNVEVVDKHTLEQFYVHVTV